MDRRRLLPFLFCTLAAGAAMPVCMYEPPKEMPEPLVVVVNPASGVTRLSQDEVVNLFMGRQKRFANGRVALPVEPVGDPELRGRFYQLLVNVPLVQVRSFWARMSFCGLAQPPRQAQDAQEVIDLVLANPGVIGFVGKSQVDSRVRVVLTLAPP